MDITNVLRGDTYYSATVPTKVLTKINYGLIDVYEWLNNLVGREDWMYSGAKMVKNDVHHIFFFRNSEDASLFTLRWA